MSYSISVQLYETGEARPPRRGEWFLGSDGKPAVAPFDFQVESLRILRVVPDAAPVPHSAPAAGASFSDLSPDHQIEQLKRELDNALQREEAALKRAIRVERELAAAIRERDGAIATESETNRTARSLAQKLSARIADLEEAVIDSALEARRRGGTPPRDFPTPEQIDALASEDAAARRADSLSVPTYGDGYRDAYLRMSREVKP